MAAETQYTANTGMNSISTANSNLDGTGSVHTILTGAANGTLIKTVTVKAIYNTTQGMVRLFVYNGSSTKLISEIEITAVSKSATVPAFETTIPLYVTLESGWELRASTEKGEAFNVIAEAQDWEYYTTSVRPDTTVYFPYSDACVIDTANPYRDGTGTLVDVLLAGADGLNIWSIIIKAQETTTAGTVRLFLYDGTNTRILKEVPVAAITQSATTPTFYHKINFENGFALKSGWYLKASTEKAETFTVMAQGCNWNYPA